jgi:hypothetical protein
MTIDPTCLLKGLEAAKQHRDRFDMTHFGYNNKLGFITVSLDMLNEIRHDCNTAMCLAGWASAYIRPETAAKFRAVDDAVIYEVCGVDPYEDYENDNDTESARNLVDIFYKTGDNATIEHVEQLVHEFIEKYTGVTIND